MAKPKNTSEKPTGDERTPAGNGAAEPQASYFLSLSLENIRCFGPKQTLDLSDGDGKPARWTIILGINGTGKTTLLQSLVGFELLPPRAPSELLLERVRFSRLLWIEYHNFQRGGQQESSLGVEVACSPAIAALPALVARSQIRMFSWGGQVMYIPPEPPVGNALDPPWCCAYGAGRRMGPAALSGSGPADPTASLFSENVDLRNPEEWLLRLHYAASVPSDIQATQKQRLAQVKQLLLNILPEEIEAIEIISPSGTHPTHRVEFKTPYGWVPLRQLGYGYQTLITWVTDLANRMVERYPDSPNPLAEPAVVAVDEIDLHLHPQWQRKLMSFLTERFPNTQFIATAHSPLIVQAAADANLAVLRREGDHVVIDNDVDTIRNWRVDQILTSDLFGLESARPPQIEGLLAERKKILTKPKLTSADKRRLEAIEAQIGDLPMGESAQEVREREKIREALELLMKERGTSR
jgi:hypothetical protein